MKALNYLKKYLDIILAFILFFVGFTINRGLTKPYIVISKQDETWNLNDEMLQKFNLGFKRLESSLLWVSTIIESDIEHYKKKDLNSWMFLRFNTISNLEPRFYENYVFGGVYLSIIKDDIQGASILYRKGISIYPNDRSLLNNAAFHFYFEAKDLESAYPIFKRLNSFPNKPLYSRSALSRIEAQKGNLDEAFFILSEYQKKYPPETFIGEKIYNFRYSVKAEIDLACLNSGIEKCAHYDLDNNPYVKVNNRFQAAKAWEPYRPKWKN